MEFKKGQVVLFNSEKSIFSKLITLYNKNNYGESKCVHSGIIAGIEKDYLYIFEPKTLRQGFDVYIYKKKDVEKEIKKGSIIIREPKAKLNDIWKNCAKYQSIKYGILDIIMIGFYWLTKIKIQSTRGKMLICSEAVVRVLFDSSNKQIDFEKEFKKPYDFITPMDIYKSQQLKSIDL